MEAHSQMSPTEDRRSNGNDVVAEAIAVSKRANELRDKAIAQLLAQREQIDRDLQTLGHVASTIPNGNGDARQSPAAVVTKTAQVVQQARTTQFKKITLAQIGKLLLAEHGTLHGKDIEKLARAGGFKGGAKNFQNYMPVAFKRAGGFENIGGNKWRLNDTVKPQK
jgi:hypothetical protein